MTPTLAELATTLKVLSHFHAQRQKQAYAYGEDGQRVHATIAMEDAQRIRFVSEDVQRAHDVAQVMSVPHDFYEQVADDWKPFDPDQFDDKQILHVLPNGATLIEHPTLGDMAPVYIINHEQTRVAATHWHSVSDLLSDLLG